MKRTLLNSLSLLQKYKNYEQDFANVYRSIETGETIPPRMVCLELTYRCNAKCKFCARWKEQPEEKELTFQELKQVIDELADLKTRLIDLTGGEPFLKNKVVDLIDYIYEREILIAINTNGLLLSKYVDEVKGKIDYLNVSIDSVSPGTHDEIRGVRCWDKAIEGIRLFQRSSPNIKINIGMVLVDNNLDEILNYQDFANKLNCSCRFQPVHDDKLNALRVSDNTLLINGPLDEIKQATRNITAHNWVDKLYYTLVPHFLTNPEVFLDFYCPVAARTFYMINPYGYVYPCESRRDILLGNIREQRFMDIVNGSKTESVRKQLYSKHRGCVCWYRCVAPDMILYQFPNTMANPITGFSIKRKWNTYLEESCWF